MTNEERIERLEMLLRALSERVAELSEEAIVRRNLLTMAVGTHVYPHPMTSVQIDIEKWRKP